MFSLSLAGRQEGNLEDLALALQSVAVSLPSLQEYVDSVEQPGCALKVFGVCTRMFVHVYVCINPCMCACACVCACVYYIISVCAYKLCVHMCVRSCVWWVCT